MSLWYKVLQVFGSYNYGTCCFCYLSLLRRVFTITYLKETVLLGYIVLQLFCIYNLCYTFCYQPCYMFCTLTLILSEVRLQCPIQLFFVVPFLCFSSVLLRYFLNDSEMVPSAPVITGVTFVFTFHTCCISIVWPVFSDFLGFFPDNFSVP